MHIRPQVIGGIPPAPGGFHDLSYSVTANGMLAILRAEIDVWGRYAGQRYWDWRPDFDKGVRARLTIFDGQTETIETPLLLNTPFVVFDRAANGNWITADKRCDEVAQNARVVSSQGKVIRHFQIGDAVEHLQCDSEDGVWVGYFDEATSQYFGLIRFNHEGQITWRSSNSSTDLDVFDCYSLNVTDDIAWTCYYTDFPIVRIDRQGIVKRWLGSVIGVKAIAVEGMRVLLAGGYDRDRDRLALFALDESEARLIGEARLDLPEAEPTLPLLFQARADALHIVRNRLWYRVSVRDVMANDSSLST